MKKTLIGIILLIGMIAFLGGCTEKTISCLEQGEIIHNKISELNYCEQDEDCAYRGDNCPLQDRIMNKNADLPPLEEEVKQYLENCGELQCEQIAHFPLECQEGKCVQIIEECFHRGEKIPDEEEFIDAKCCEGLEKILKQSPCEPGTETCMENGCPHPAPIPIIGGICAPCGNGLCEEEYGENKCNCPKDCGVTIKAVPPARSGPDDYFLNESIEIQMRNNSNESIWYPERIDGCNHSFFYLDALQISGWEEVSYGLGIACIAPSIILKELPADETASFVFEKGMTYYGPNGGPLMCEAVDCQLSPGSYRARTVYYNEKIEGIHLELPEGGIEISSQQFEIILPHTGISIKTDKEEYRPGESVKMIIKNGWTEKIWHWDRYFTGIQILEEQWENVEVYDDCGCLDGLLCEAPGIVELEPGEEIMDNWDLKIDMNCKAVPAEIGKYRAWFSYYRPYDKDNELKNTHKVYSEEFIMKDWPPD